MAIFIDGEKVLNLPEQVEQNRLDIKNLAAAQDDDHSAINTNTNDINALKTQMTSVESITLKGDETNNKAQLYRSNKADMGSVQFKTINGVGVVGEGDIPVATSEGTVQTKGDQTIAGVKTFSDPIHTNQIANENGGALVRYKDTENASVYGGVNSKSVIMGSGERPNYSMDGADFEGKPLALKEDLDTKQDALVSGTNIKTINNESMLGSGNIPLCTQANWDLLMAKLGVGRWANQTFYNFSWSTPVISDPMLQYYNNYTRTFANLTYAISSSVTDITFATDTYFVGSSTTNNTLNMYNCFYGLTNKSSLTIRIKKGYENVNSMQAFCQNSNITSFNVVDENGEQAYIKPQWIDFAFNNCPNLVSIDGISMASSFYNQWGYFTVGSPKLKHFGVKDIKYSINISYSTAFEEADLVEIISNLDLVSTTQTLTMGATNLAKLTSEEILVATGKGWQLA